MIRFFSADLPKTVESQHSLQLSGCKNSWTRQSEKYESARALPSETRKSVLARQSEIRKNSHARQSNVTQNTLRTMNGIQLSERIRKIGRTFAMLHGKVEIKTEARSQPGTVTCALTAERGSFRFKRNVLIWSERSVSVTS